jgi:hypothetical protein
MGRKSRNQDLFGDMSQDDSYDDLRSHIGGILYLNKYIPQHILLQFKKTTKMKRTKEEWLALAVSVHIEMAYWTTRQYNKNITDRPTVNERDPTWQTSLLPK